MLEDEQKINRQEPITSVSEDKLNRRSFMNYVVNIIDNASVFSSSFVVSINGKWGDGKTSFKNLIVENLRSKKNEKNLLLEYDSINFENCKEIGTTFVSKIISSIKSKKSKKYKFIGFVQDNKKTILLMMLFGFLIYGIFKPNILRDVSSLVIGIFTIRKLFGFFGLKKFLTLFRRQLSKVSLSSLADVISRSYLKADVVHKILYYDNFKNSYDDNVKLRDFLEVKCDYDKIILFIDNFDLMEPQQIKHLIKTINSMLCLPKFVFVLFYDKHLIEKSLNNEAYSGSEFLEKFVNIQLDLPMITNDSLLSFLQSELQDKYNLDVEMSARFKLVKKYFTSLNKIYSFLDTFNINYKIALNNLKNLKDYMNKEDFLYLEIIRFFENDVYREIRKGKLELTSDPNKFNENKYNIYNEDTEAYINNLVKLISVSSNSNNLKKLVLSLFPGMNRFLDSSKTYVINKEALYKNKSVGSFDYFDYYFVYDLSENIISNVNFAMVMNNIYNHNLFTASLKEIFVINDDKMISYISNDILSKMDAKIFDIVKDEKNSANNEEFIKNVVWLYSYSSKDKKIKKLTINIFSKYFTQHGFNQFLAIFKDLIDEKNFKNFVYLLDLLYELRKKLNKSFEYSINHRRDIFEMRKIIFSNLSVLFSEEYLSFLKINSYDSYMQKKFVCAYLKSFYKRYSIEDLTKNKYLNLLSTSALFKNFKAVLFNKFFDLLIYYLNFCIKKNVVNDTYYCVLNPIFLYNFDVNEIIKLFKERKMNKNCDLYKLLKKISKFNKKYYYMSNIDTIQNRKILSMLYITKDL